MDEYLPDVIHEVVDESGRVLFDTFNVEIADGVCSALNTIGELYGRSCIVKSSRI